MDVGPKAVVLSTAAQRHVETQRIRLALTTRLQTAILEQSCLTSNARLRMELTRFDVLLPEAVSLSTTRAGSERFLLDREKQRAYSQYLRRSKMKLPDFVRLLRGETEEDPRPNKALEPPQREIWTSYRHRVAWADLVQHGVCPRWKHAFPAQVEPPSNHNSANRALNSVIKNIRKGQDANQFLVLDLDLFYDLDGLFCSPFGAVPKGEAPLTETARIIHDLSFPSGASVNDNTEEITGIPVKYDGPTQLAQRMLQVESDFPGKAAFMSGDVAGAFRHIPIHADHVGRFAGTIPELNILIIDLCCPFGWSQSPVSYWLAGSAINHIYSHQKPGWIDQPTLGAESFDGKVWCDDHNCIEPDVGTRLPEAALALRAAMTEVLGPSACNDDKFTSWGRTGKSLGLLWDLDKLQLSMPDSKISKARLRLSTVLAQNKVTRSALNRLLGSLRHVITCIPTARAFIQRLSSLQRCAPPCGTIAVSDPAKDDIKWLSLLLDSGQLNGIPLQRFANQDPFVFHVNMDASDHGLCALFPARKEYLQIRFDDTERALIQTAATKGNTDFGINLRELMSAVFASLVWGAHWKPHEHGGATHVLFLIDNTAAISWNNKRTSKNAHAQLALRILALCEVQNRFYATAQHIPGVENTAADAGSRIWESDTYAKTFANLCSGWKQVVVPPHWRKFSAIWERFCAQGAWPRALDKPTNGPGNSGRPGA